jgi:hypothetical protein
MRQEILYLEILVYIFNKRFVLIVYGAQSKLSCLIYDDRICMYIVQFVIIPMLQIILRNDI